MGEDEGRKRRRIGTRPAVSATEAAKNFGRLVERVREAGATYVVERGGVPVAQVGPVDGVQFTMADFKRLMAEWPRPDGDYLAEVSRVIERHNRPGVRRNPWR